MCSCDVSSGTCGPAIPFVLRAQQQDLGRCILLWRAIDSRNEDDWATWGPLKASGVECTCRASGCQVSGSAPLRLAVATSLAYWEGRRFRPSTAGATYTKKGPASGGQWAFSYPGGGSEVDFARKGCPSMRLQRALQDHLAAPQHEL